MKINPVYKVRNVAGENMILLQGKTGGDMTRVVAFNASALLLWNTLYEQEFQLSDAVRILLSTYEVDESTAIVDAERWISVLRENGLLLPE